MLQIMNKITFSFCALALLVNLHGKSFAQETYFCGTDKMVKQSLEANPQLLADFNAEQARLAAIDAEEFKNGYESQTREMLPILTIPVVFHILHQYGSENISDAQVHDAMRIMNEDYRKLNADFAATVPAFTGIAADCEIEFKLAQKDPTGACHNGIDRIYSALTNSGDDAAKLNYWPRSMYLNIWVVKTMADAGVAGYAYLPGTAFPSSKDGIIILSTYIGSIGTGSPTRSHALGHEIGHFLNLKHCWGGTNNPGVDCSGTDNVSDTPPTEGWTTCNLSGATCGSPQDNVQNFMEYSYCSTMFTAGQKTRARAALANTSGQRNSLVTTSNLAATGVSLPSVLCQANFESNNPVNTICAGDSLTFTDLSWNGTPTGWTWNFAGGTPNTSGLTSPTVTYNTPGIYDVSLSVTNSSGTVATTKVGYVTVNPTSAMFTGTIYTESFEGSAIPNANWQVRNINAGSNTWVQTNTAASTGTMSARIVNATTYDGHVDELIGPSIDMTAITGSTPSMTFKVAHAQRTSTSADKLQVYVSTNCGENWTLRKTITGAALSTGGVQSAAFTPTSSQWALQTVNLSGYTTQTNLFFMFRFTSNGGNNIYVDDINILGTVGIDELSSSINFNVYPNPAEDNTVVSFDLIEKGNVTVDVIDVVGRKISSLYKGALNAGEYQYNVASGGSLAAGIYIVQLNVDGHNFSKKLIVK